MSGVRSGVGMGVESWFDDNIRMVVGDSSSTYFWTSKWMGGVPLRVRYPQLLDLAANGGSTVEEMASLGWEEGGGAWLWRRHLLAWEEEEVREWIILLHNVVL